MSVFRPRHVTEALARLMIAASVVAAASFWMRGREAVVHSATSDERGQAQAPAPGDVPQVTGVSAVHRSGQTFITWREVGAVPDASLTMKQLSDLKRELGTERRIRYRVYRAERPIQYLRDATLVGEAEPLSAWNLGYYGREPRPESPAFRYVIADGQPSLDPGSGLLVHHVVNPGSAYYAVTSVVGGVEAQVIGPGNRSDVVIERPGGGAPVLQRTWRASSFIFVDDVELRVFVRWESPENTARPGQPHDYLVAIPPIVKYPAPVGIHMHEWNASMHGGFGWWFNANEGAILVASNQEPYDWWTGYHEAFYRGQPRGASDWASGVVHPYTERRLLSFVDWLAQRLNLDLSRLFAAGSSMGGSGSIMMAIRYPSRIAWAASWVGVHVPRATPQFRSSYEFVWGKPEWNIKFEDGTPVWDHYSDPWYLRQQPDRDVGFITFSNGKNDGAIGWQQAVEFLRALQETRQPHLFVWGMDGHGQRARMPGGGERVMPLDLRTDLSLPAFTRSSLDDDPGNGDPASGDSNGQVNGALMWDPASIRDTPDQWAITVRLSKGSSDATGTADITPRRLQRFRVRPGDVVSWTNRVNGRVIQAQQTTADRWGLVTLSQVQITRDGSQVTVRTAKVDSR